MPERSRRQELILSLISERPIRNQRELAEALAASGMSVTQSTLSRELKTLGIAKGPDGRGGYRYLASGATHDGELSRLIAFVSSIERAGNLIVVKTPPGAAQGVARVIDQSDWKELMGTIAGDDTILLIGRSPATSRELEKRLRRIVGAAG